MLLCCHQQEDWKRGNRKIAPLRPRMLHFCTKNKITIKTEGWDLCPSIDFKKRIFWWVQKSCLHSLQLRSSGSHIIIVRIFSSSPTERWATQQHLTGLTKTELGRVCSTRTVWRTNCPKPKTDETKSTTSQGNLLKGPEGENRESSWDSRPRLKEHCQRVITPYGRGHQPEPAKKLNQNWWNNKAPFTRVTRWRCKNVTWFYCLPTSHLKNMQWLRIVYILWQTVEWVVFSSGTACRMRLIQVFCLFRVKTGSETETCHHPADYQPPSIKWSTAVCFSEWQQGLPLVWTWPKGRRDLQPHVDNRKIGPLQEKGLKVTQNKIDQSRKTATCPGCSW